MKVHELIENLRDIDPDGECEVQLDVTLLRDIHPARVKSVRRYSVNVVRIVVSRDADK